MIALKHRGLSNPVNSFCSKPLSNNVHITTLPTKSVIQAAASKNLKF